MSNDECSENETSFIIARGALLDTGKIFVPEYNRVKDVRGVEAYDPNLELPQVHLRQDETGLGFTAIIPDKQFPEYMERLSPTLECVKKIMDRSRNHTSPDRVSSHH